VNGPGGWTVEIDAVFRLIDNGDSIQAVAGDRALYLSAMRITTANKTPSAAELLATASRTLRSPERLSHQVAGLEGAAEIRRDADSFALHVRCRVGRNLRGQFQRAARSPVGGIRMALTDSHYRIHGGWPPGVCLVVRR
jgi:hypothetical protein